MNMFRDSLRKDAMPAPGTFSIERETGLRARLQALIGRRAAKDWQPEVLRRGYELYGDAPADMFVEVLGNIKEILNIPEDTRVIYPGSSTHVGVAKVFGKENVTHVDPDIDACQILAESGYKTEAIGIEEYNPETRADVMVAHNAYGSPSIEVLEKTLKPGAFVIANNYTHWATELAGLTGAIEMVGAVLPAFNSPEAHYLEAAHVPADALETRQTYYKIEAGDIGPGTPDDHTSMQEFVNYPDAVFIFQFKP